MSFYLDEEDYAEMSQAYERGTECDEEEELHRKLRIADQQEAIASWHY